MLAASVRAVSQQPLPDAPAETPVAQTTAPSDTVRALHQLFQLRRNSGWILVSSTGIGAVVLTSAVNGDDSFGSLGTDALLSTAAAALYGAPLWVVGVSKLTRFSKKKEQEVLAEFAAGQGLPPKIRRRLKPAHFTPKPEAQR